MNDSNRAVLATVLKPHDEHGMDMMVADELDSAGLKQFCRELGHLSSGLRLEHGESGFVRFLEEVQAMIDSDPRSAG